MAGSIFEELKRRRVIRVALIYLVASWLMAQVADVMMPALQLPDWTVTLVVALLVLGFPIAMVLAWAFDVGPEGVVRTEEQPGIGRAGQMRAMGAFGMLLAGGTAATFFLLYPGRPLALNLVIALGILLVAGAALLFFLLYPRPTARRDAAPSDAGRSGHSVAVLPFLNVSGDPDNEYFSDGIAEELINVLTRIDGLKVAARTSSRYFKGRNEKLQTIAGELGVDTVLEGSVRRAGRRVRVTATLVDAADGYHLWSESYDRELDDILAVQDDIARSMSRALRLTLSAEGASNTAPTANVDAYQVYLRAAHSWKRREPAAVHQAIRGFEEAVRLDEQFARAHAALGAAYHKLPLYDTTADIAECRHRAELAALKALELDPELGEANATLASILADRHQYAEAERIFQRAVSGDPNDSTAHHLYANFLLITGRSTRAFTEVGRAYALDPLNAAVEGTLGGACFALGRTEEAIEHYRKAGNLGWGDAAAALCGGVYLHTGDSASAAACLRAGRLSGASIPAEVVAAMIGDSDPAAQIQSSLQSGAINPATAFRLCAMRGSERIFSLGVEPQSLPAEAIMSLWCPPAEPIRRHRRFAALIEGLGLPAVWRIHGWPDACRPERDGFSCS